MAAAGMINADLTSLLPAGGFIVLCARPDDATAWRDVLGADRCLALPLDSAPVLPVRTLRGASDHLAWQHQLIAGLDQPGWLTSQADAFDTQRAATLLLPDPLDPPQTGARRGFGRRSPVWRVLENKTIVDTLWDTMSIPRARSIVADSPANLAQLGGLVDQGAGVVCAVQPGDGSGSAGGDGIYWWSSQPPPTVQSAVRDARVRLMPLLPGLPTRLHGLVTTSDVIPFPPLEVVALPRLDRGTFLCAGTAPMLGEHGELLAITEHAGQVLRDRIAYRGAFSIDGILTTAGFRPTDLNARLTSAMEAVPSPLRIRLHLANMLAREDAELDPHALRTLARTVFGRPANYTLYGAATTANDRPRAALVRWQGEHLRVADGGQAHGQLTISPSLRGWLLTAKLRVEHLLPNRSLNSLAPQVFELSDAVLGTDFGALTASEGALDEAARQSTAWGPHESVT
jgi:hypothetical protein